VSSALRSSANVSVAILVSRVLGVVRDAIFARVFGVSGLTDAYVAAFRIPNLLRDLFAEGALSSAFVPTFSDALNNGGRERAFRLGNLVLGGVLALTGGLTLAGMVFSDQLVWLISRGFSGNAAQVALGGLFAKIMMPILALVSVSAVWMGMLNAQHHYLAPAYAPAMFNVTSILCGVALIILHPSDRTGLIVWSAGTTASGLVQAVVQLPSLWRLGYRVRPTLAGLWRDSDLIRIVRLMGPATVGLAAVQINIFVNTQFAAALGQGPLTYLQNAFRLFYLPVGRPAAIAKPCRHAWLRVRAACGCWPCPAQWGSSSWPGRWSSCSSRVASSRWPTRRPRCPSCRPTCWASCPTAW
jgi:putative peptidoglycan lipid II flippase